MFGKYDFDAHLYIIHSGLKQGNRKQSLWLPVGTSSRLIMITQSIFLAIDVQSAAESFNYTISQFIIVHHF